MMGKLETKSDETNETVKQIQAENKEWQQRLVTVEQEMSAVKDSLNMAHNVIRDETKNRLEQEKCLTEEIGERKKEIGNTVNVLKSHYSDIKEIRSNAQDLSNRVSAVETNQSNTTFSADMVQSQLDSHLKDIGVMSTFPVHRTVIAQRVWYEEDEDILEVTKSIIHSALSLPQVQIVRAERKSGQRTGSGLVKIEVQDEKDVKLILGRKKELKDSDLPQMREIFLRKSKGDEVLMMERNMDTVLSDMGIRGDYVRLSSGHLVRKERSSNASPHAGRGYRGGRSSYRGKNRRAQNNRRYPSTQDDINSRQREQRIDDMLERQSSSDNRDNKNSENTA